MKNPLASLVLGLSVVTFVRAAEQRTPAEQPPASSMQVSLQFRAELAASIASATFTPEQAVERLRDKSAASGLPLPQDADFGEAALDVGLRLLGFDRPKEAEVFFRAAEKSFDQAARRTPASRNREKGRYLERLSMVRGNFLGKAAQAKTDIDAAIGLNPEDKSLKEAKAKLGRGRAEDFKQNATEVSQEVRKN